MLLIPCGIFGCGGTFTHSLRFDPHQPLRVAVAPFSFANPDGSLSDFNDNLLLDRIGDSEHERSIPANRVLQNLVQTELGRSHLDIVLPALVEAQLSHNGFYELNGTPRYAKIDQAGAQTLCDGLLQCDAILFGTLTRWDRSYRGIETTNAIAFDLKLVSAKTGLILYEGHARDADSRGLTKGPTGLSDLVIEPVKALSSDVIVNLARRMVRHTLNPLTADSTDASSGPPPVIFAAATDVSDSGVLSPGIPITVVMYATAGCTGSISIREYSLDIPMIERSPGHYYGQYIPLPTDSFSGARLTAAVTDGKGRRVEQQVGTVLLSLTRAQPQGS